MTAQQQTMMKGRTMDEKPSFLDIGEDVNMHMHNMNGDDQTAPSSSSTNNGWANKMGSGAVFLFFLAAIGTVALSGSSPAITGMSGRKLSVINAPIDTATQPKQDKIVIKKGPDAAAYSIASIHDIVSEKDMLAFTSGFENQNRNLQDDVGCTERPSTSPSLSSNPSSVPTYGASLAPSESPSMSQMPSLSSAPSTSPAPSRAPSMLGDSIEPSLTPSLMPSTYNSSIPSMAPSESPTNAPSCAKPVIHATGYMVAWHSRGRGLTVWPEWQPANYGCADPAPSMTASCGEGANIEILDFPSNHMCNKTDDRTVVCDPQGVGHIPIRCDTPDGFDQDALILTVTLSAAELSCNGCINQCDLYGGDAVQRLFIFTNCHYDGLYSMEDSCSGDLREDQNGNRYCEIGNGCQSLAPTCTASLSNVTAASDGHFLTENGQGCVYTI